MKARIKHNSETIIVQSPDGDKRKLLRKCRQIFKNFYENDINQLDVNGVKYNCKINIILVAEKTTNFQRFEKT